MDRSWRAHEVGERKQGWGLGAGQIEPNSRSVICRTGDMGELTTLSEPLFPCLYLRNNKHCRGRGN